jgi:hypothetical protein
MESGSQNGHRLPLDQHKTSASKWSVFNPVDRQGGLTLEGKRNALEMKASLGR